MYQCVHTLKYYCRSPWRFQRILASAVVPGFFATAVFCLAVISAGASPLPDFPEEGTGWKLKYSVIAREDFSTPVRTIAPASEIGEIGLLETKTPITGAASLRGSSNGTRGYRHYFNTRPETLPLNAGATYRLTFSYRIVEEGNKGFEAIFYSPTGGEKNQWLNGIVLKGPVGTTGVAELEATLFDFPDYRIWLNVIGSGTIVVDNIRLTEGGQLVFEEDFESVGLGPGFGVRAEGGRVDDSGWLLIENGAGLKTDPNVIVLPKLMTCRLSFDYRVIEPTIDDRTLVLKLFPYTGSTKSVDLHPLLRNATASRHFSTGFSTGSTGPYSVSISAGRQARVLIDNILIEQGTPRSFTSEPASYTYLENAPFPRLGNYLQLSPTEQVAWGGFEGVKWRSSVDDLERRLSLYDVLFGFTPVQHLFDPDLPNRIKALNPNAVLLPYVLGQETPYIRPLVQESPDPDGSPVFRYDQGLASEWLVKDARGVPVNDMGYPGILKLNISPWCERVGGKSFLDYQIGQYRKDYFGSGIWDGLYIDNLFARMNGYIPTAYTPEKLDYDINRNGKPDEAPALLNRISYDAERALLEGLISGTGNRELIMGNNGPLPDTRLASYVNGYLFENFGLSWNGFGNLGSKDSELGWRRALDSYMIMDKNCRDPKINVIEGWGWSDNGDVAQQGRSEVTASDIQQNRFTFATALLGETFYEYDLTEARSSISWFDELAVEKDGVARESFAGKGYLGKALGPAVELSSPAKKVWEQNFEGLFAARAGSGQGSRLSRKIEEVVAGKRSLIVEGETRSSDAWPNYETVPDFFRLKKGKKYILEFSWKVLEDLDYGLWFKIFSEKDQSAIQIDALFTGESGRVHYPFTPLEDDDYRLRFSILSAGKIAIDDVRITEGGAGPWRRDFENGIVFVNPYCVPARFDAKAITGALERTGIKRIKGSQAPEVNSGAPVKDNLVLDPFDAIILLADHKEVR
ncbi:MAG: putative glycoside hydrolase [Spirochaetes bacterium]|nr:putative glycoside hydrolase [Spirochaetota bacterium]